MVKESSVRVIRVPTFVMMKIWSSARQSSSLPSPSRVGNTFPVEYPVYFEIIQDGHPDGNFSLDFDYGDGLKYQGSLSAFRGNYTYNTSRLFVIRVKLGHLLGFLHNKTTILMKESLTGLAISDNAPTVLNEVTCFKLSWETLGTGTVIEVDFGDGEKSILGAGGGNVEASSMGIYRPIIPLRKQILLNHTYNKIGAYVIFVKGWNDVSFVTLSHRTVTVEKKCQYPRLTILGVPKDPKRSILLTRDRINIISARVVINCQASSETEFEWKVYKGECQSSNNNSTPTEINTDLNSPNLVIPPHSLPQGSICFKFRAAMKHPVDAIESIAHGYARVVPGKLKAAIVGGNGRTVSSQRPIRINGSLSQDPDLEARSLFGVQLYWFCRRVNKSSTLGVDTVPPSDLGREIFYSVTNACASSGLRMLNYTTSVWEISPGLLRENQSYAVMLVMRKDTREAIFEQVIEVVNGIIPEIEIK